MKRLVLAVVLALGLCVFAALPASAENEAREAEITYRSIKIVLDGQEICPRDAAGNEVEPFILDGTTYLPVRAVADALGLEVRWRGSDSTVMLTGDEDEYGFFSVTAVNMPPELPRKSESAAGHNAVEHVTLAYRDVRVLVDGVVIQPKDAGGNAVEPFILDGTTYLPVRAVAEALGLAVDWDAASGTVRLSHWLEARSRVETRDESGELVFWYDGTYEYDAFGRMTRNFYSNHTSTGGRVHLLYDDAGRLVERSTDHQEPGMGIWTSDIVYKYSSESGLCVSAEIKYGFFDEPKLHTGRSEYEYDGLGRLVRSSESSDGQEGLIFEWTYDGAGRVCRLEQKHGSDSGDKLDWTEKYSYDGEGRIVLVEYEAYGEEYSYSLQEYFSYDADGRRLIYGDRASRDGGSEDSDTQWRNTYDEAGRLIRVESVALAQEDGKGGKLLELTEYFYDERGRLVRERSSDERSCTRETVYTYDANGNVLRCEEKLRGGVQTTVREYEYVKTGGWREDKA